MHGIKLGLITCLLGSALCSQSWAQSSSNLLADIFQDHMVLQRNAADAAWGDAQPGEAVVVSFDGHSQTVTADATGHWTARLDLAGAGGPHSLDVKAASGAGRHVSDILAGDVFLCAGQSNMQFDVSHTDYASTDTAAADNDRLRLTTIPLHDALTPQSHYLAPIVWEKAAPATVRQWSASCYFFGQALQKKLDVPIGLVVAAWGGSGIRTWLSQDGVRDIGGYETAISQLDDYRTNKTHGAQAFGRDFATWWRDHGGPGSPWAATQADLASWDKVPDISQRWEDWGVPDLAAYDGALWYGVSVTITAKQARGPATLDIGPVDEIDQTWVNGQSIGATGGAGVMRTYPVPAGLLKAGSNTIIVNAVDTWAKGGMYGDSPRRVTFADGSTVSLEGWRYHRVPTALAFPPRAPWDNLGGVTLLYNGMISPLGQFGFRGAVWYQGESNVGDSLASYQNSLRSLMHDWRRQTGQPLPFVIAQLPNFGPYAAAPTESGWANVREAQRRAVAADGNAALAVLIDSGSTTDIHPTTKRVAGERLASAAFDLIYGPHPAASGIDVANISREGADIRVDFRGSGLPLVSYSGPPNGFELCDDKNICQFADRTRIEGNAVILSAPSLPSVTKVRFCWADGPRCTLYGSQGVPVGPFEAAIGGN